MKANMGLADKMIRILVAIIIYVLYFTGAIGGTLGVMLIVIGGAFIFTSVVGVCPLYLPFGWSTREKKASGKV